MCTYDQSNLLSLFSYVITSGLRINFEETEYFITEGGTFRNSIRLEFQNIQCPFTLILRAVSIDKAETNISESISMNFVHINADQRAIAG